MTGRRLLFVLHWLVVGGEETEVRLLAQHLRPQWTLDVVVCHWRPGMPEQSQTELARLGVPVDTTPYTLSDEETVAYLARLIPRYDVVVACQAVPYVHPAMQRLSRRPPFVEHGGLVSEALSGPKDLTDRYVGVCASIRDAAASRMPDRPWDAVEIPSMVDLGEFHAGCREDVRREWDVAPDVPVLGWVGRLDRKKRVEDVLAAAELLGRTHPEVRWVIVGGPNFFYPEHAAELHRLSGQLGVSEQVRFLGDRADVPRLLAGMDALVWLSEGEGMPHILAEAGAAARAVVATRDNGSGQQLVDGVSGLFVPSRDPAAVADVLGRLAEDTALRNRLGRELRRTVESRYAADVVVPQWLDLLNGLVAPRGPSRRRRNRRGRARELAEHAEDRPPDPSGRAQRTAQRTSKRSRLMTLSHAATKSCTNRSCPSSLA
jgi:glycosyltransferase involved in cell wall biosynthesis